MDELFNYKKVQFDQTTCQTGPKCVEPSGSFLEQKQIQKSMKRMEDNLAQERVQKINTLSQAQWNGLNEEIVLIKQHGHALSHAGYTKNNKNFLYPEEALFFLDTGQLEVMDNEVPMSLQEAYSKLLDNKESLQRYQAYSHLSRLGYKVVRHLKDSMGNKKPMDCIKIEELKLQKDEIGTSTISTNVNFPKQTDMANIKFPNHHKSSKSDLKRPHQCLLPFSMHVTDESSINAEKSLNVDSTSTKRSHNSECNESGILPKRRKQQLSHACQESRPWYKNEDRFGITQTGFGNQSSFRFVSKFRQVNSTNWHGFKSEVLARLHGSVSHKSRHIKPLKQQRSTTAEECPENCNSPSSSEKCRFEISYDVHQPNSHFKKSSPKSPHHRLVITSVHDEMPTSSELKYLKFKCKDNSPIHFAVIDSGKVHFYILHPTSLPALS